MFREAIWYACLLRYLVKHCQSDDNSLIDVFLNLCSYLVLYIHNRLIYVGNYKSRHFVSGRVSFIIFLKSIKIFILTVWVRKYG